MRLPEGKTSNMDRIAKNVALKFEIKEEKATIIRG
jgi:hypothetical protein